MRVSKTLNNRECLLHANMTELDVIHRALVNFDQARFPDIKLGDVIGLTIDTKCAMEKLANYRVGEGNGSEGG